jgi:hypothetical protein
VLFIDYMTRTHVTLKWYILLELSFYFLATQFYELLCYSYWKGMLEKIYGEAYGRIGQKNKFIPCDKQGRNPNVCQLIII